MNTEKILKQCFPNADKIRITENSTNEKHRSVISNIIDLTIEYEEDGRENRKYLIMKVPTNQEASSFHDELGFFTKEALMYDIIIPRLNNYLEVSLTPFCFKTIDSRIIILENLTISNYEKGSNDRLNANQCRRIIKDLAHFHAATYKVSQDDPDILSNKILHISPTLEWRQRMAIFWEPIFMELLAKSNESLLIPKFQNVSHYLKREDDDATSKLQYSKFKFSVLNHGDFRNENLLLRYASNGMVDGVKFVDFQISYWSTPVCDFMYLLLHSAQADVLENHFEILLEWYLECLNTKLKTLSCSTIYTEQNFLQDLQTLYFFPILLVMNAAFIFCPLDRAQLLDTIYQKNTDNIQHYIEACLKDELFTDHVLSGLKLCEKLGLLKSSHCDSPN